MQLISSQHKNKTRSGLRSLSALVLLVALSIIAGACMTSTEDKSKSKEADNGLKFPHAIHLSEDLAIDCSACHDTAAESGLPTIPSHDICSLCHELPEGMDSGEYTPELLAMEACNFCHTRPDRSVDQRNAKLTEEIKFAHATHEAAEVACDSCHGNAQSGIKLPKAPMMPVCMECHAQKSPELNDCAVCHNTITKDTIPTMRGDKKIAHDAPWVWETIHGREAQMDPMYCAMCHDQQEDCEDCHSRVAPKNHTLSWRNHTHGIRAAWDRTSCAVCHEEDTCQKCHENMTPKSHRGGWGGLANRHCVNCHYPPEQSGCVVCHEDIDHKGALPSPHLIGVYPPNCATCHPGGLPNRAPHLMNSTVHCAVCHN